MKKLNKSILAIGTIAAAVAPIASVVSCGDGSTINPEGTLTVAVWKGNDQELAAKEKAFKAFETKTGIKVKPVYYNGDRIQAIQRWATANDLPDVLMLDSGDFPQLAQTETIVPIKGDKFTSLGDEASDKTVLENAKDFKGLAANVFAPLVGKVTNGQFTQTGLNTGQAVNIAKNVQGAAAVDVTPSVSVQDGSSVYGLPKDFSTLAAYINTTDTKNKTFAEDDTHFESIDKFLTDIDSDNFAAPKTAGTKGVLAKLGQQPDLARKISLLNVVKLDGGKTFFEKYKDYSKTDFEGKKGTVKADLIKALGVDTDAKVATSTFAKFLSERNKSLGNNTYVSATADKHGYGWNGEAFDNKAVSAVIEGNWYSPKDKQKTVVKAIKNYSGIFYSGWALSASNNDEEASYKFMEYMTFGDGANVIVHDMGMNPANISTLSELYDEFDRTSKSSTASTDDKFTAKSFLAHASAIPGATPNLLSRVYPQLSGAYGDYLKDSAELAKQTLTTATGLQVITNKIVDNFYAKLAEL